MRKVAVIILFLLIVGVPYAQMQDNSPLVVANTEQILLTSETNGHDYRIAVALPDSYSSSEQSYPVLYVLDPQVSLLAVTEFARFLAPLQLPELIIVGIGYPTDVVSEINIMRERDYYNAPDAFLDFIRAELFPLVESTYRTDGADRGLIGFSYGGNLVYHVLATDPGLFNRYIAIDSDAGELMPFIMRDDDAFRASFADLDLKLFISAQGTETVSLALQTRAYEGLDVTGLSLGNVTHEAALHFSLPPGILAVYAGE